MCGIAGIYQLKKDRPIESAVISRMCNSLVHRGPDDSGIYFSQDKRICLGHTRLSIIDLTSSAHQPMSNREGTIWLVHNGEIYNYRQLQDELKKEGYKFRSTSDTEVIIYGYQAWGIDGLLRRLRGMFAFAIYDERSGQTPKLIIARDRLGIKPLYYYQDKEFLFFSSEVRALLKSGLVNTERNNKADIAFLIFGYIPAELTTIKNIFSLPVGSYILLVQEKIKLVKYYELINSFLKPRMSEHRELYNNLRSLLSDMVNIHLISDAPLGVFLSGGIDSSALVALASKMRDKPVVTVSIVFDEEAYSERPYQKIIAQRYKTDHREVKVTERDFYGELNNIFEAMDQPTIDGVNTYFVSRAARQVGLKTVLSGLGGDEVFCGYETFRRIRALRAVHQLPRFLKSPLALFGCLNKRWRKLTYLKNSDFFHLYLNLRGLFIPKDVAKILDIPEKEVWGVLEYFKPITYDLQLRTLDAIDWLSYMDINFYLKDQLLKDTDTMGMYHSLEIRVPYLDHVLVDYVVSLDSSLKMDKDNPKPLLVKSLKDMLPDELVFRKKQGFVFPFDPWFKKQGRGFLEEAVAQVNINKRYARGLWLEFLRGSIHWSRVWALVVLGRSKSE